MSEKLSNLLDKNVVESDLDDFLRQCRDDSSLIDSWQRYNLAGDVIRNEISDSDLEFDVAARVMARLESEQMDSKSENSNVLPLTSDGTPRSATRVDAKTSTSKPWFALAIAASMLLGVGVYFIIQQPVIETPTQQIADNKPLDKVVSPSIDHWQTSSIKIEATLNSLLVEHSEFTSVTGMNGLGSYSKFIAYQN